MKKYREIILPLLLFAAAGCEKSEYRITEPRPTLEVTALQDSYIINQPAYLLSLIHIYSFSTQTDERIDDNTEQDPRDPWTAGDA